MVVLYIALPILLVLGLAVGIAAFQDGGLPGLKDWPCPDCGEPRGLRTSACACGSTARIAEPESVGAPARWFAAKSEAARARRAAVVAAAGTQAKSAGTKVKDTLRRATHGRAA